MTNSIAVWLGLLIVVGIGVDALLFGSQHFVFLGKEMFALIDWLAFWR